MSLNDPIANMLSKILNAERLGNKECAIKNASNTAKKVLELLRDHRYIGSYEEAGSGGGMLKVHLLGMINKCGVIKPRFSVKRGQYEKFEKMYLPARNLGLIIISTSSGIITASEAKKKAIGGKLIAYCY